VNCDRCHELMRDDETGVFNWEKQEGGHIACFVEPISVDERREIAERYRKPK